MDLNLDAVLHGLECGVLVVVDGRIELVNPAMVALFGVERVEWRGAAGGEWFDAIEAALAEPWECRARHAAREGFDEEICEDLRAADGRILECDFLPVRDGSSGRGFVWLVWDVSPDRAAARDRARRQRAEILAGRLGAHAQRTRAEEALAGLDAARAEALSAVSAQLHEPLAAILEVSAQLTSASLDANVQQQVSRLEQHARALAAVIEPITARSVPAV